MLLTSHLVTDLSIPALESYGSIASSSFSVSGSGPVLLSVCVTSVLSLLYSRTLSMNKQIAKAIVSLGLTSAWSSESFMFS